MFQYMQRSCKANIETLLRGALLPIALVHVLIAAPAEADCSHCDTSYCPPFNSSNCSYGVVQDECNCCDECAKGPGETCGDVFGSEGICADGYECIVQVLFGVSYTKYYETPGVCKSSQDPITMPATTPTAPEPTEPADDDCRNKCGVEFCMDGRNRYCSATENAFESQEERGVCQHTTCKACRLFVSPTCPTCPEPVNKSCLRKYFLCIAEHYKEDNIMLELSHPLAQTATGKIICHVPETEGMMTSGDGE